MANFIEWLSTELEKREWSQSDLSRRSGISTAQIARLLNGQRNPGKDTIASIAKAFKLPPEQAFRAAGLLPPTPELDEDLEQIVDAVSRLPKSDREEILAFIHMKENLRKKK